MTTRSALFVSITLAALAGCASSPPPSKTAEHLRTLATSGFVPVDGGRVWYSITGNGTGTPLLVLHGGPGIPHDYLANLDQLGDRRPVVFYDQLGCGKSERPTDGSLWTVERFVKELQQVRDALGLDEVLLYGHSWGSMLATSYMMTAPKGVRGLILAGPSLSIPRWSQDAQQLVETLDAASRKAIHDAEHTGNLATKEYEAAVGAFYARYLCRCDPWPQPMQDAMANMNPEIYGKMDGPSEFQPTGTLKDFDITPKLGSIAVPTLFVCGEFDEARPDTTHYYASLVPGAACEVIPGAAHIANFDQPELYLTALRNWMRREGL